MAEYETEVIPERAVLVGIERQGNLFDLEASLDELARLTETAGAVVVGRTSQRLDKPNPKTFIGSGKVQEVESLVLSLAADIVIFDDELTPSQQANLEKSLPKNVKILDRTALILDIFALHAVTKEGRLQVRLAQNQYLLPRLRGMWSHLASNRMGGGVGSRFGEGESQLEVDRRMVRKRIASIKRSLEQLEKNRQTQRAVRRENPIPKIALAGYTNVGKSRLLNALTGVTITSEDKLFATLDSTTRRFSLPMGRTVTITDTVGFIRKLPTTLIEAFKSTLMEIVDADLIIHVIDISSQEFTEQRDTVNEILQQIGAEKNPRLEVFNKCDLISDDELAGLKRRFPHAIFVSAATHEGFDELFDAISSSLENSSVAMCLRVPFKDGSVVSAAHEMCTVIEEQHDEHGTLLDLIVPKACVARFLPWVVDELQEVSK